MAVNPKSLANLQPAKKGEVRNPKGKPVGTKHLSTHIQEMLNDPDFELKMKDGSILKERPLPAIIKTAVARSISGDNRWADWLAKHGYGEKLNIEHSGEIATGVANEQLAADFAEYLKGKQ